MRIVLLSCALRATSNTTVAAPILGAQPVFFVVPFLPDLGLEKPKLTRVSPGKSSWKDNLGGFAHTSHPFRSNESPQRWAIISTQLRASETQGLATGILGVRGGKKHILGTLHWPIVRARHPNYSKDVCERG